MCTIEMLHQDAIKPVTFRTVFTQLFLIADIYLDCFPLRLTSDEHQTQRKGVMSMQETAVNGEASRLTAEPEGQTIKHHAKGISETGSRSSIK